MLSQRSAMHKPGITWPLQPARYYPDNVFAHVGYFSTFVRPINLFLTRLRDLCPVSNVATGDLMNFVKFLKHIGNDNSGATAVEYGLIVSLIVIAMIGALNGVANETIEMWSEVRTASEDAMN